MRRRAVALGVAAMLVYVGAVLIVARIDPFLARPILDGLAPPPLYRWVQPPPAFAATNEPPESGRFVLSPAEGNFDPAVGSGAGVFSTRDFQVSLALAARAIDPKPGAVAVTLTIGPLAPGTDLSLPSGYQIAGNVIRVDATYRPTGGTVTALARPSLLTLSYPIVVPDGFSDTVLFSSDGRRWTPLASRDHPAQQSILATVRSLGYFAVGQVNESASPSGGGSRGGLPRWLELGLRVLAFLALALAIMALIPGGRRSRRTKRRPPDDSDAFDPWEV